MQDEPIKLPDVYQATLDTETLRALVQDLCAAADVLEVLVKEHAQGRAAAAPGVLGLLAWMEALESGAIQGLQVRYRFEGALWLDTLLRRPEGVALTRMRLDDAALC